MSWILHSSKPEELTVKIWGCGNDSHVYFNDRPISMARFLAAVEKVLTSSDLQEDDLRLYFVSYARSLQPGHGYNYFFNKKSRRLKSRRKYPWPEKKHVHGKPEIRRWRYRFSMIDFLFCALYVLQNTDLKSDDPRIAFLERLKTIQMIDGQQAGHKRFAYP